jgi:hypothetical protein
VILKKLEYDNELMIYLIKNGYVKDKHELFELNALYGNLNNMK